MHFLQVPKKRFPEPPRQLGRPRPCVAASVLGLFKLCVDGEIYVLDSDTWVVRLPEDVQVLSKDGEVLQSSFGGFYVTIETIDPIHGVLDGVPSEDEE